MAIKLSAGGGEQFREARQLALAPESIREDSRNLHRVLWSLCSDTTEASLDEEISKG